MRLVKKTNNPQQRNREKTISFFYIIKSLPPSLYSNKVLVWINKEPRHGLGGISPSIIFYVKQINVIRVQPWSRIAVIFHDPSEVVKSSLWIMNTLKRTNERMGGRGKDQILFFLVRTRSTTKARENSKLKTMNTHVRQEIYDVCFSSKKKICECHLIFHRSRIAERMKIPYPVG